MSDIDYILDAFLTEGGEALEQVADDVMNLEQGFDQEAIDRVFRALHSIKGNAGMLGMTAMAEFVHTLEDTCSTIRSGDREVDRNVADGLLKSFDFLTDIFADIRATGSDQTDYGLGAPLIAQLQDEGRGAVPTEMPEPPKSECVPNPPSYGGEKKPAETTSLPIMPRAERINDLKALVVDDDFLCRNTMRTFISKFMPCYVATDGSEAIEAVRESMAGGEPAPYDLIIMDIMMPGVDGLDAVKAIRQIERDKGAVQFESESIILMASAVGDDKTMLKAVYECGANAYFVKPIDFESMRRQLVSNMLIAPEAGK